MAGVTGLALSFMFVVIGCATTIPVSYIEPARLNMADARRIAISSDDSGATSFVSQRLIASGKYTVAAEAELREWEQWKAECQMLKELADIQATAVEISAADLVGAYQSNAVRADSSYSEKLLKTSGIVNEIGKSSGGNYFARLDAGRDSIDI